MNKDFGTTLNIAAIQVGTYALGPGFRSVVWVQGCHLNCPGCIAKDWIPFQVARLIEPFELARELVKNPAITGVTISGGEPMLQAKGLVLLVDGLRKQREINILVYTGYELEKLKNSPPNPYVPELLDKIDALIDGPYNLKLNDNKGLRGSSNQRLFFFTSRLDQFKIEDTPRNIEVNVKDGHLFIIGVPDQPTLRSFENFSARIVDQ